MEKKLGRALALRQRIGLNNIGLTEAAVLIPIFCKDGEYHILFTLRSDQVPHHKGQISFPGGARSQADATLKDTALRESREEIGLKSKDATVVGLLDDTPTTTSGYIIAPFVAFIPYPYKFTLSSFEISDIFSIPVSALLSEANKKKERYAFGGQVYAGYSYEYEGRVIWGATAKIVEQLLEIWKSICET